MRLKQQRKNIYIRLAAQQWFRKYSAAFKDLEIILTPWIQILASAPIKKIHPTELIES